MSMIHDIKETDCRLLISIFSKTYQNPFDQEIKKYITQLIYSSNDDEKKKNLKKLETGRARSRTRCSLARPRGRSRRNLEAGRRGGGGR